MWSTDPSSTSTLLVSGSDAEVKQGYQLHRVASRCSMARGGWRVVRCSEMEWSNNEDYDDGIGIGSFRLPLCLPSLVEQEQSQGLGRYSLACPLFQVRDCSIRLATSAASELLDELGLCIITRVSSYGYRCTRWKVNVRSVMILAKDCMVERVPEWFCAIRSLAPT